MFSLKGKTQEAALLSQTHPLDSKLGLILPPAPTPGFLAPSVQSAKGHTLLTCATEVVLKSGVIIKHKDLGLGGAQQA